MLHSLIIYVCVSMNVSVCSCVRMLNLSHIHSRTLIFIRRFCSAIFCASLFRDGGFCCDGVFGGRSLSVDVAGVGIGL